MTRARPSLGLGNTVSETEAETLQVLLEPGGRGVNGAGTRARGFPLVAYPG